MVSVVALKVNALGFKRARRYYRPRRCVTARQTAAYVARASVSGLVFGYKLNAAQPYIFERPDVVRRRSAHLAAILRARSENHCIVNVDETWVFDGMTKNRGWNDTIIPQIAPAVVMEELSCGEQLRRTKAEGRLISALSEEGVVSDTTKVIVSGRRPADDDYHRDMNHAMFEN
ncbi:unnamed protein product [Cylicocyclus nassatus]|uniref:Uncharacterized protein n=1 Tax=Cylicocyclus nassatus TaxID=53992 RepID=A0AA36GT13_CYLNA|nr:unnamed protein product [Cylicocyclus nassatus]